MTLKTNVPFPIGFAVPGGHGFGADIMTRPNLQTLVASEASEITAENEMKMDKLSKSPGVYDFARADALIDWADSADLDVHGHALVFGQPGNQGQVPGWMKNYSGTDDQFRIEYVRYISDVATRFAGRVVSWDVVNEAIARRGEWNTTTFYNRLGADHVRLAFDTARQADPNAVLYYNDFTLEDDEEKLAKVLQLIGGWKADGIGFQMHTIDTWPDDSVIRRSFRKAAATGLMVKVTESDVRMNYQRDVSGGLTPELEQAQADRFYQIVNAYIDEVPQAQRGGFTFWGIYDNESWFRSGHALLWAGDGRKKKAYHAVDGALDRARTNTNPPTLPPPPIIIQPEGTYELEVLVDGETGSEQVKLFVDDTDTPVTEVDDGTVLRASFDTMSRVYLRFLNDGTTATGDDRNVRFRAVGVNGHVQTADVARFWSNAMYPRQGERVQSGDMPEGSRGVMHHNGVLDLTMAVRDLMGLGEVPDGPTVPDPVPVDPVPVPEDPTPVPTDPPQPAVELFDQFAKEIGLPVALERIADLVRTDR